eukprot:gnl/Hemi2/13078_TR4464_c0_g1_i1.p2 gnl/Hemi2/13078_TR4464_c0_g1~~gnl/Hemi2/13078_TR4464_c0_g1_i1.p2  ORF type:complete len:226 (+),score=75.98 gnl/Hemi2/13078_TR4464_c0_g1_i1:230-907(+)
MFTIFGSLNIFRVAGDFLHVLSIVLLFAKMSKMKSSAGISLKTQELYLLVFITRYLDIFTSFISLYNTILKLVFLATSATTVYYMRTKYKFTNEQEESTDRIRHWYLILPCFVLALFLNHEFSFLEVLWTFSIYLEVVAILPQLFMLYKGGEVENLTSHYMICLGVYRLMYIFNWVERYLTEDDYHGQWIIWISGVLQVLLYADFYYYYAKSKMRGTNMPVVLPA